MNANRWSRKSEDDRAGRRDCGWSVALALGPGD
ncbi:hypothetical protein SO3561_03362 [Streptomyces olivochromogenes]|uniref:Uncharacterized protein n=1 Tax=Streptomyces olivochromogenes TaxID=1963 RepID=A0A250VCG2_STROL|nr:hypothetical protein SO3561_03362 [Streptomyces olivochromogenes]